MAHADRSKQQGKASAATEALPVAAMVESIVGCKWSVGLLRLLADGCTRPSALLRASDGLTTKVMNERLRKMLRFGIAQRTVVGDKPPLEVHYELTEFGRRFVGILEEVRRLQEHVDRAAVGGSGSSSTTRPAPGRVADR